MLTELDLDVVLDRVLEAAQELTEARYAALGVLNEDASDAPRASSLGASTKPRIRRSARCRAGGACSGC